MRSEVTYNTKSIISLLSIHILSRTTTDLGQFRKNQEVFLTLEDGADTLSPNVSKGLPFDAA
jgi:hypothetical protein